MEIAAVVISSVVALSGLFIAHNLIVQKDRKDRVMDLFTQVNRHIQDYRYNMTAYIQHRIYWNAVETGSEERKEQWAIESDRLHETLRGTVMDINSDCLLLHMLLGPKSDALGKKLKVMASPAVEVGKQTPQHLLVASQGWLERHDKEMKENWCGCQTTVARVVGPFWTECKRILAHGATSGS
ncbi:MAG: hypothetical protein K8T91_10940 [Planctomycetes bacterium]|nr:hypothetical protein [Planctomycetota bacterium]